MIGKKLVLNNGIEMPVIGIGGWAQKKQQISEALSVGYRLIDTAAQYGNEDEVGAAIAESGISREEIFLTTKLWTEDIREHKVQTAVEDSLKRLETDYIDLYLIHWPAEGFEDAWLEMEKMYKSGKIRAIGVSNFEEHHLVELEEKGATITPAINQVESHPYFSNQRIIDYASDRNIVSEAWCPLGGPGSGELAEPIINEIAEKNAKTTAQVILRWQLQRGVVVIPKSSNRVRMEENIDIFDFELNDTDMGAISLLEQGKRLGAHPDHFDF